MVSAAGRPALTLWRLAHSWWSRVPHLQRRPALHGSGGLLRGGHRKATCQGWGHQTGPLTGLQPLHLAPRLQWVSGGSPSGRDCVPGASAPKRFSAKHASAEQRQGERWLTPLVSQGLEASQLPGALLCMRLCPQSPRGKGALPTLNAAWPLTLVLQQGCSPEHSAVDPHGPLPEAGTATGQELGGRQGRPRRRCSPGWGSALPWAGLCSWTPGNAWPVPGPGTEAPSRASGHRWATRSPRASREGMWGWKWPGDEPGGLP